ncbi:MAG TPA: hypothetical protein DHV31_01265, partial [Clostridiales bacterium]|nr:hypothetical protein [Clostridiales bacterium]
FFIVYTLLVLRQVYPQKSVYALFPFVAVVACALLARKNCLLFPLKVPRESLAVSLLRFLNGSQKQEV